MASSILFTKPVEDHLGVYKFTATITADTDGSVVSVETPFDIDGWLFMMKDNPGSPAPQASYGITLTDEDDIDVMGGAMASRSATVSAQSFPQLGTDAPGERYVDGTLTINVSSNNVNGAVIVLTFYFKRIKK